MTRLFSGRALSAVTLFVASFATAACINVNVDKDADKSSKARDTSSKPEPTATAKTMGSGLTATAAIASSPTVSIAPSASPASSGAPAAGGAQRNVGVFTEVVISNGIEADLDIGPASPLTITGDDDVVGIVKTDVSGDTLTISLPSGSYQMKKPLVVHGTVARLTSLDASSGGIVHTKGLACEKLTLRGSSSGKLSPDGKCKAVDVKAESGAKIEADGLAADDVKVEASSGAHVNVQAKTSATGSASSGARVHVSGNPATKNIAASSGATVD